VVHNSQADEVFGPHTLTGSPGSYFRGPNAWPFKMSAMECESLQALGSYAII
jgi:hypothetical protein